MKSLRKSILTLLALTLFGGAGAWAQQGPQVTEIVFTEAVSKAALAADATFTASGSTFSATIADNDNKMDIDANTCLFGTAEDYKSYTHRLKSNGATASDKNFITLNIPEAGKLRIAARTGSNTATDHALTIQQGETVLYNEIVQNSQAITVGEDRVYPYVEVDVAAGSVRVSYNASMNFYGFGFFVPEPAEIELTKSGANQWSLGQTPDYDLELQVEYYEAHALKNIPAGWQVKVNGVDKTSAIVGDSLLITETDSVTLVPTDPRRVKSVTLSDDVSYITIDGLQLIGKDGDSWATIRDNNPDKIDLVSGYVIRYTDGAELKEGEPSASCGYIDSVNSESSNYNADTESHQEYRWCQSN